MKKKRVEREYNSFNSPNIVVNNLSIYYQNVNGLRTHIFEVRDTIINSDYDVLIFSESGLADYISDAELNFSGYRIYRCDRSSRTSSHAKGGGVLIAVRNDIKSQFIISPDVTTEQVFVLLHLNHCQLLLGSVYIPPASNCDVYLSFSRSIIQIKSAFPSAEIFIAGDFNLPRLGWIDTDMCSDYTLLSDTKPSTQAAAANLSYAINLLNL